MEMPDEFKTLVKWVNDPAMQQAYAGLGETPVHFFLEAHADRKAMKRLDAYLAYVMEHPDRNDKASALWRDIDENGRFGGTREGLKLFMDTRRAIKQRLR